MFIDVPYYWVWAIVRGELVVGVSGLFAHCFLFMVVGLWSCQAAGEVVTYSRFYSMLNNGGCLAVDFKTRGGWINIFFSQCCRVVDDIIPCQCWAMLVGCNLCCEIINFLVYRRVILDKVLGLFDDSFPFLFAFDEPCAVLGILDVSVIAFTICVHIGNGLADAHITILDFFPCGCGVGFKVG